ncbi:hypothetical protein J3R83DRAFT_14117 [Lanmaoa asiatica]|nr:hypothetical protein J3R83DRAFT_14117 [Lanmaoa asiatica]
MFNALLAVIMVSSTELKNLCDHHQLTPVFARPFDRDYVIVTLNSGNPPSVDIQTTERFKRHCDFADYHDVDHPWRPYIPGIVTDAPERHRWLCLRLFDCEPHHLVTQTAPFRLTEASSSTIIPSLFELLEACSEIGSTRPSLVDSFKSFLPPLPNKDILEPFDVRGDLMAAIQKIGPQLLEIIGVCVYLSCRHQFPTSCRSVHKILSWSKRPTVPLRGVVVELQSITLQQLTDYLDHNVPVHYIYRDDEPSSFDPRLLNAKDLDAEQAEAHAAFLLSSKKEKSRARDERRSTQAAPPPGQKGKKIFMLQDRKGRSKQITKQQHAKLVGIHRSELQKRPTGDVAILYVDEVEEEDSDDAAPSRDFLFVPQKPWRSSEPEPEPQPVLCVPLVPLAIDPPLAINVRCMHPIAVLDLDLLAEVESLRRHHSPSPPWSTTIPLCGRSPSPRLSILHADHRRVPDPIGIPTPLQPGLAPSTQHDQDTTMAPRYVRPLSYRNRYK